MKQFNVIVENINSKKFVPYNIMPYLVKCYYEAGETDDRPGTIEEFKTFVERNSMYRWWARGEYEIVLKEWPAGKNEEKIDVHWQVMMNIDVIVKLLMEEVDG